MAKSNLVATCLGRISWEKPAWIERLTQKARLHPLASVGIFIAILIFICGICLGYHWYKNLPKPERVIAQITAPGIPPIDEEPNRLPLTLDFGLITSDNATDQEGNQANFNPQSVAPLNQIEKDVTDGISLSPQLKGIWHWQNGSELNFTPDSPWPAGQKYHIQFTHSAFAPQAHMEKYSYDFSTPALMPVISDFKFYQDLKDPKLRQAVATINFNYPIDMDSLTKNINLQMQTLKADTSHDFEKSYQFNLTYDKSKRIAYLHSEALALDDDSHYLNLTITKGVQPLLGNPLDKDVTQKILIPSLSEFFKITKLNASIIRNLNDQPEQLLVVETTVGVTSTDLNNAIHVYQLPQDYPATAKTALKKDYRWQNPGEVTSDILQKSTVIPIQVVPTDTDIALLHSFKFKAEGGRYLYIKIDKGIAGYGGFKLTRDYNKIVQAPIYPKEISFLHKGALLALGSEKKISVLVRGLPAAQFEIARILPDDINHLVTQSRGRFDNPRFFNSSFNQNNISKIFSEVRQFNNSDPAQVQYAALDLSKYLANAPQALGLFILTARDWDVANNIAGNIRSSRLVLITDMGIIVKDNTDESHDVFVQSITQGTPIASAQVEVLGKNGLAVATQMTDSQGHAQFPSFKDFTQDREPAVYLVRKGNDTSFIPYFSNDRRLNYSKFDVGGVQNTDSNNLTAYLFSDRGIYRPGDDIHVGMIIKKYYAQAVAAGLPLEATIVDPRGITVFDQKVTVPSSNLLTLNYRTEYTSPTGNYTVTLAMLDNGQPSMIIGSLDVLVQEFLPDRMKIAARFSPLQNDQAWIAPEGLKAIVNLKNLFGSPAVDRRVTGRITLQPEVLQFPQYADYVFVDPLLDAKHPPKTFTNTLTDTTTDKEGKATFDLGLQQYDKATYRLTFFTQGYEAESGRSVSAEKTILVTPLKYLIGYKTDGDLNFIQHNGVRNVHFIAIDPMLKPIVAANLHLQLYELHPVTTLVKKPDGTYEYQSAIQQNLISNNPITVPAQGWDYSLPSTNIGDYLVKVEDANNTVLTQLKFSVVGASQHPTQQQAQLTVKLNKNEFNPGDDIQMQITAPYAGAGLITIERDKIYAQQWFKTDSNSTLQTISIPKDFQGDGYVNVAFVRAWGSDNIFLNPLSYAVVPFTVNRTASTVNIQLKTPELIQPGQVLPITYSTDKPAKIIVYAVDEGILQVAHYQTPDPLAYFFQKHALGVTTQQIVDLILPDYILNRELSAVGGDGGEEAKFANLNPFKRKTDKPIVYWSGIVDADSTPRTLTYSVPDYFNGTLRVMTVAVAANAVGATEQKTQVRGPFVINPNVPTFVAPGDMFDVGVDIANNVKDSGNNASVQLKLIPSAGLKLMSADSQTLVIAEQGDNTAHFKLQALDKLGSAQLTFTATLGDKTTTYNTTLSVRPAMPFQTNLQSNYSKEKMISVKVQSDFYPEFQELTAQMSTSPLILINGLQRFLENFPFGCTEQLVSKAFVALVMADQPGLGGDKNFAQKKVAEAIALLRQRQMDSGGFSYWPGIGENYDAKFASVYAVHFLTEAQERGYNVPPDLMTSSIGYLQSLVTQDISNLNDARIQAYAIYLLTRNEIVTTNYLTNLQLYLQKNDANTWQQDIAGAYIAASYQLLKNSNEANRIISQYKLGMKNSGNDFYDAESNDARYLDLLALHFPDRLQKTGAQVLLPLVHAIAQNDYTTLSAAYDALALSAYQQANATQVMPNLAIAEIINQQEKILKNSQNYYLSTPFDNAASQLRFKSDAVNGFFYQITQAGFARSIPTQAVKQGLEIYREYRDKNDNVITQTSLGSDIEVHIQVRTLNNQTLNNVAIVDLLPGGFEVDRDSVKTDNLQYVDIREDRLIFFGSFGPNSQEITYKIRATNVGEYTVPPVVAGAMYDPSIKANSIAGKIKVNS